MARQKTTKAVEGSGQPKLQRSIVLVGLMGAGKTSVGLRLAAALGVPMIDSDDEIEKAANMTIAEIFETHGEAEFRSGERRVLARLMKGEPRVIATGGGAFMDDATRALMLKEAVSVWLKADLEVLVHRTAGRTHRPLLNKGNPRDILAGLIETRYPIYGEADVIVESELGQTHEAMADKIIAGLRKNGRAFVPEAK